MCCWTHDERDKAAQSQGTPFTLAEHEHFRCQCKYGVQCRRRATAEDFLCDWCRGRNHNAACGQLAGRSESSVALMRPPLNFTSATPAPSRE